MKCLKKEKQRTKRKKRWEKIQGLWLCVGGKKQTRKEKENYRWKGREKRGERKKKESKEKGDVNKDEKEFDLVSLFDGIQT